MDDFNIIILGGLEDILVQNNIFTAEAPRTRRKNFLFGGEVPPNKKASVLFGQGS